MAAKCPATATLQKKLTAALSTCTACAPQVAYLEELAASCPELSEQVAQVRALLDHLSTLAEVGMQGIMSPPEPPSIPSE